MEVWLVRLYVLVVTGLAVYGCLGAVTLFLYGWHGRTKTAAPSPQAPIDLPRVTVQLPIYNEQFVVQRLIDAAVALDYPAAKVEIQVIDDSTDGTAELAAQRVRHHQAQGVAISYLHRPQRTGYKAGALAAATAQATGDLFAIFDADFLPGRDFLQQTIPHFATNPRLGFLQARWAHLNAAASSLTHAQAIALDQHFLMEQTVQHRAGMFPKFNGSAGVWRRTCLEEAGGWRTETVCEDLCLSTRAGLQGWQFLFLPSVTAPAELPTTLRAFKNQQARWAKGSLQCLLTYFRPILTAAHYPLTARLYSLLAMSRYCANLLLMMLLILQLPLLLLDARPPSWLSWYGLTAFAQVGLFVLPQMRLYSDWKRRIWHIPSLILLVVGMSPNQTRAMLSLLFQREHPFIRTPKGNGDYRLPFDWIVLVEGLAAVYALVGAILSIHLDKVGHLPFFMVCLLGFGYVIYADT